MTPDAATFDFHDTLAICDDWFQLEIRGLLPAFLDWYSTNVDPAAAEVDRERAVSLYRGLRMEIMEHGIEVDAVSGVNVVLRDMNVCIDPAIVKRGVCEIMCATLPDSRPVPGVVNAIRSLKQQGVKLGVVSSAVYHPFLEWSLKKFGILDQFDTVMSSARCGFYKSRPDIYSLTLDSLGATPERSVHVGDSLRFDVDTASRINMLTVWYNANGGNNVDGHAADAVVTTLRSVDARIIELYREHGS